MSGRAWRIEISDDLLFQLSINTLKLLACVICIWLEIIEGSIKPEDCLMSQTDGTSAAGWLRKSNFNDKDQLAKMLLSHKLAELLLSSKACLYSQWFPGIVHDLTDSLSLSRDHNLADSGLVSLYHHSTLNQTPHSFAINPLPNVISSYVTWLIPKHPDSTQSSIAQQRTKIGPGLDGVPTCKRSDL
jgi:hypothetical protein